MEEDIKIVNLDDKAYPENLRHIYMPPEALYVKGAFEEGDRAAIALVGSRKASPYGLETCQRLAYELARRGITVVSGLARGIDSSAHIGALKAGGRTIAVLGSGLDYIYPRENKKLAKDIEGNGAVVSQFPPDTPPFKDNFPKRNRIISGLSLGVVVVEAADKSGALITANYALDEGREVFAVPGKVTSQTSGGTNKLIKAGAKLVENADDIISELEGALLPFLKENISQNAEGTGTFLLTKDEKSVYDILSDEPMYIDEIAGVAKMTPQALTRVLLELELKKAARSLPGNNYVRHHI